MMTNLFSSFDPSTSFFLSSNWAALCMAFLFISPKFWVATGALKTIINMIMSALYKEFKVIVATNKYFSIMMMALFLLIMASNIMGLMPYVFTSTSHMAISLPLAIPMWLGMMLYGWINFNSDMFAHLVPQSTPGVLMPFMVLIESISNVIRPLTLAIRLSANMIAGHLLMTLLGNQLASSVTSLVPLIMIVQLALVTLEMAVSLIQSYVFSILMTLYISEIEGH